MQMGRKNVKSHIFIILLGRILVFLIRRKILVIFFILSKLTIVLVINQVQGTSVIYYFFLVVILVSYIAQLVSVELEPLYLWIPVWRNWEKSNEECSNCQT